MKKILLILIFFISFLYSQENIYYKALKLYNLGYYAEAYDYFEKIDKSKVSEQIKVASINYYKANCLLNIGIVDGAVSELEKLVNYEPYSYFFNEALFSLINIYYNNKNYDKVIEKANLLFNSRTNFKDLGTAYFLVGQTYFQKKQFDSAIVNYQKALNYFQTNRNIPATYFSLAYTYELINDYKNAVKYYELLLSNFSNSQLAPSATVRIAICYYKLKDYENAIVELKDTVITSLPKNNKIEANYILANAYFQNSDFERCIETINNCLKNYPSNYLSKEIRFTLAFAYFQQKNYNEAFKIFNLLSKYKDTISSYALYWSAECKRYENKYAEALQYYEEYMNKYPYGLQINDVKLNIANIYIIRNEFNKASKILVDLLNNSNPQFHPKILISFGELYLKDNKINIAYNYFNSAEAKANDQFIIFRAKFGKAIIAYQRNKYEEALFYLNEIKNYNFDKNLINFYFGEIELAKGNYTTAIKYYDLVKSSDYQKYVIYGKAYAYFNSKDYENAKYLFEDYVKNYSKEPNIYDAQIRLADCYYALKKYKEANTIYSEVFSKKNSNFNDDYAQYQYIQSLYRAGNFQAALEELSNFQKKYPNSKYITEAIYLNGWIYAQKEDYSIALSHYKKLIQKYSDAPIIPIVLLSTGDIYYNLGKYDSSLVYYQRVVKNYDDTTYISNALNGIIYIATNNNDLNLAKNLFDGFVNIKNDDKIKEVIRYKSVEMFFNAGDYSNTINSAKVYLDSVKESSNKVQIYYWLGYSYSKLKMYEDAKSSFTKIIDNYKDDVLAIDAAIELGKIYSREKDYDNEIKTYEKVISYFPEDEKIAELYYKKGLACLQKGDISEAVASFNDIIIYFDQSPFVNKAKYELASLELSKKNYSSAENVFTELSLIQNDDVSVKAQFNLGVSQMEQQNYSNAISNFIRIINFYPDYPEWHIKAYFKIAECYEILKDIDNAKKIYNTIIQLNFNQEYTKEAQKKLKTLK